MVAPLNKYMRTQRVQYLRAGSAFAGVVFDADLIIIVGPTIGINLTEWIDTVVRPRIAPDANPRIAMVVA
jgi:hypothetical protein